MAKRAERQKSRKHRTQERSKARGEDKHDIRLQPSQQRKYTDAHPGTAEPSKQRFCRVDPAQVEFFDEKLKSNTFSDKNGAAGSYGEKAYNDLLHTRGKGFRQEKNKKKRGSYRGGSIDTSVHSIKFASSDNE